MSSTAGNAATVMLVFWADAMPIVMANSQKIAVFFMKAPLFESAFIFYRSLSGVKTFEGLSRVV
jgi:hypothetical protein